MPFKISGEVFNRPNVDQKQKGIKVGLPFLVKFKIDKPTGVRRHMCNPFGLIFTVKHSGKKSAARPVVMLYIVPQLVADGKCLLTVWQIAIYGDVLWLVVLIQKTSIFGWKVIPIFDLEAKITGHVLNRAYGGSFIFGRDDVFWQVFQPL